MLDRESQTSAEELAHQQERFDIHVMAFADRSAATVSALQQLFALDRATAERLLAEAPVVVKRRAPPDIADALLDALVPLGAQVVLLPAPPSVAPPDTKQSAGESAPASNAAGAAAWGGLDLQLPAHAHAGGESLAPTGAAADAVDPTASTAPPPPPPAHTKDLEFDFDSEPADDVSTPDAAADDRASDGEAGRLSEPRSKREPLSDPAAPDRGERQLGLGDVPPLPRLPSLYARASARALSVPPPPIPPAAVPRLSQHPPATQSPAPSMPAACAPLPARAALPPQRMSLPPPPPARMSLPPPPPRMSSPAASAPARMSLPPLPALPRIALPLAPRLPTLQRAAGAHVAARSLPAGPISGRGQRALDPGHGLRAAPALELEPAPVRARDRERARRAASLRPPTSDDARGRRMPELDLPAMTASHASLSRPVLPDLAEARSPRAPEKPKPADRPSRSRALAVLQLMAGLTVLYLGLRLDDTVLHGNASPGSLLLHGLALYALGSGLLGLRP